MLIVHSLSEGERAMTGTKALNNLNIWRQVAYWILKTYYGFVSGFRISLGIMEGQAIIKERGRNQMQKLSKNAKIPLTLNVFSQ